MVEVKFSPGEAKVMDKNTFLLKTKKGGKGIQSLKMEIKNWASYVRMVTKLNVYMAVSYTHLRAHETRHDLICRVLLEKKKKKLAT